MPIANCKRCGRIFSRSRRDICSECIVQEDREFTLVRSYLRENRDADMNEIIEATQVEMDSIIQMIQDGRLILVDNPNLMYSCARCGEPTQSGRYCSKCSEELVQGFASASSDLRGKLDKTTTQKRGYYSR